MSIFKLKQERHKNDMKKNETREETLERLARDANQGAGAAKRFETLVKRVAKTPSPAAQVQAKEEEPETD
jgi:hypothetical protein